MSVHPEKACDQRVSLQVLRKNSSLQHVVFFTIPLIRSLSRYVILLFMSVYGFFNMASGKPENRGYFKLRSEQFKATHT